jgi:heptosyltransferase I
MKKFLFVKTSSLGDIIQAFPALSYLGTKFPDAQIDWIVEKPFVELVTAHPLVNHVYTIDSKLWRKGFFKYSHWKEIREFQIDLQKTVYDVVFDLQGNIKSGIITTLANAKAKVGFGWSSVHEKPNVLFTNKRYNPPRGVNIREDYLHVVKSYFNDFTSYPFSQVNLKLTSDQFSLLEQIKSQPLFAQGKKVMVCSGSAWPNKQLTKMALLQFLEKLQKYLACTFVFVWGSPAELELTKELQSNFTSTSLLLDRLSLPILQNLMSAMDLVVAMDSLPLHLAGTTKSATFSVFGASLASKFKPSGKKHLSFQGLCPYSRTFEKRCPVLRSCPTGACIRDLSGDSVFASFQKQWENLIENHIKL